MTEDFEDWNEIDDGDATARRFAILDRARTEGIAVAYETALAICRDPKAPAPAKSSASRTLLEIGGMLDRRDREEQRTKEHSEMSADELNQALASALQRANRPEWMADTKPVTRTGAKGKGVFD